MRFTARVRGRFTARVQPRVAAGSFHDTDTATYTAEDFRFTTKGNALYAIELGWPASGEAVIHSLGTTVGTQKIASVSLLGAAGLQFKQEPDGLHIQLPAQAPGSMPTSSESPSGTQCINPLIGRNIAAEPAPVRPSSCG